MTCMACIVCDHWISLEARLGSRTFGATIPTARELVDWAQERLKDKGWASGHWMVVTWLIPVLTVSSLLFV